MENVRILNVSSSAVAKIIKRYHETALMRTATGKEDPELPLQAEDTLI